MTTELVSRANGAATTDSLAADLTRPQLAAATQAAAAFLSALGVQLDAAHLVDTPRRMAAAYAEMLDAPEFVPTAFDAGGYDGLVVVRAIGFHSLCAHHALPFLGYADVGYQPAGQIIGLSKLAWVVQRYARRLQVQEQLTTQVADWLMDQLRPAGVAVRVRATHLCMSARGVRASSAVTLTHAIRGSLADDAEICQQWMTLLGTEPSLGC